MGTRIRRSLAITVLGLSASGLGVATSAQAETLALAYQAVSATAAPAENTADGTAPPSWLDFGLQDGELENVSGTGVDATPDRVHTQTVGVILWDEQGAKSRGRHGSMELPASVTSIRLPSGVELTH